MFNNIDILLIAILIFALIYGLYRGLISIIIPVIAIIVTFIIAPLIYNHMSKYFNHSLILKIISLIASYSIIRIILSKIEINFKKILKAIFLDWVDRVLGAVVLLFISCFIIAIIVSLIKSLDSQYNDIINQSKIAIYIYNIFSKSNYSLLV